MLYKFKVPWEILWGLLIAIATPILVELVTVDWAAIGDPTVWGIALASAVTQSAAKFLLALIGGQVVAGERVLYDRSSGDPVGLLHPALLRLLELDVRLRAALERRLRR